MILVTLRATSEYPLRQEEYRYCMERNARSGLFREVVELQEDLTFRQVMMICADRFPFEVVVLANSDITFDSTIALADRIEMNEFYALTRWETQHHHMGRADSQDAWVFRSPLVLAADFRMGIGGCDNRIAAVAQESGLKVSNPSLSIRCLHHHASNIRTIAAGGMRPQPAVPGPYLHVPATQLKESVTVNIISYRYGHLAAQAIESVICQTHPPTVTRFIDDGGGDCRHLRAMFPEVQFIERTKNLGVVATMNDALGRTNTDRCMMLGADDHLRRDALHALTRYSHDIVSYDMILTGTEAQAFAHKACAQDTWFGWPVWRFPQMGNMEERNYIHGSSLYRTAVAKKVGYSASGHPTQTQEDWMLFRGMVRNGATVTHHQEPLIFYRRHRQNFHGIS